jgi:hypothetical protein
MKNIFDYATSELSQDAVLCWLIANADKESNPEDEQLRHYGGYLLATLLGEPYDEQKEFKIPLKWIIPQWGDIDVPVWGHYGDLGFGLVIEDKTFSYLHDSNTKNGGKENQLKKYLKEMNDDNYDANGKRIDRVIKGAVYKTAFAGDQEREEAKDAGFLCFDITDIVPLFSEMKKRFGDPKNDILKDYCGLIFSYEKAMRTTDDIKDKDHYIGCPSFNVYWQWLYRTILLPEAKKRGFGGWDIYYRGSYYAFTFCLNDRWGDQPSIEIQPRRFYWDQGRGKKKQNFNIICQLETYSLNPGYRHNSKVFQNWLDFIERNKKDFKLSKRNSTVYDNGNAKEEDRKGHNLLANLIYHFDTEKVSQKDFCDKLFEALDILKQLSEADTTPKEKNGETS